MLIDSGDPNLYRYAFNRSTTLLDNVGASAVGGNFCAMGACAETEIACDDSGCSVCLGAGVGSPGGGVSASPTQGARGNEGYVQASCSVGPFEFGFECRLIFCAPTNPDVFQLKCELKGPIRSPATDGIELELGCSVTGGGCTPI